MLTLTSCFSGEKKYEDIDEFSEKVTLSQLKKVSVEHGPLIEAGISTGGGMLGDSDRSSLTLESDGQIIYTAETSPMHNIPIRGYRYLVKDQTILDRLNEYIKENNLSVWDKLPFDEEHIALDAPSTSISLVFNDETVGGPEWSSHRISYDNVIPKGGSDILKGLNDLYYEALKDTVLLETYLLYDGEKVYSGRDIENTDDEAKLFLMGFWTSTHQTKVLADGTEQETVFEQGSYNFDYSGWEDTITLQAYQLDDTDKTYRLDSIVHEPLSDYDCSWYFRFVSEGEEPEELCITINGAVIYARIAIPESEEYTELVFERRS
ncbi:MAG: hypothetical protein IIZ57_00550 [Solobacterium sp.]|nr:hypothetical protein [Solobacterium sp.]